MQIPPFEPPALSMPRCEAHLRESGFVIPPNERLVCTQDTLVAGVHFPLDTAPEDVAHKALAVNMSDLASMGAAPLAIGLSLTLDPQSQAWLTRFDRGLGASIASYAISVSSLDCRPGPLMVSIQASGTVPAGAALTRAAARPGHDIFVSGTLGDASYGLTVALGQSTMPTGNRDLGYLLGRLNRPTPRLHLGQALRGQAHACIDVSDGLAQDLGHILRASAVGAIVEATALPLSFALRRQLTPESAWRYALFGGDDYELCFTVPADSTITLETGDTPVTRIGKVVAASGLVVRRPDGSPLTLERGYDHFA